MITPLLKRGSKNVFMIVLKSGEEKCCDSRVPKRGKVKISVAMCLMKTASVV
jgi:hypothetical protein